MLQWGGITKSWSDPTIIGLFVCIAGLIVILLVYERWFAGITQLLPLRFFKNPSVVGACIIAFMSLFGLLLGSYYLVNLVSLPIEGNS